MVDKVIPYLPMDPASNLLVIELKLQKLGETLAGGLYTTSGESHGLCQRGGGGGSCSCLCLWCSPANYDRPLRLFVVL